MKIQNNKTKTATTIISALVIVLLMLLPMTGLPMVNAQPDSGQPQIINHMGPPGPLKGVKIIPPPHLSAAQEQKVIPPGVERPIGAKSVADQKVCDASAGTRSGQFTCVVIPSYDAQSTWAEGPVIYPQGSGYSSYSGIGASPYISSLGSTS
ncbi:MAG: hypothetical protein KGI27_14760, partial [Thaumarchaeota archaeon]|nr:hypothetical protein [Nitrososphaerota archaeon]